MKIAIASSGLGHVARGIETWALDTAVALEEVKREMLDVSRSGEDEPFQVTLFAAAPLAHLTSHASHLTIRVLPCLKRGDRAAKFLARLMPGFCWRWGFTNTYGWEQFTFWMLLWLKLRRGRFDILHVQDPGVANWCRLFRKFGLVKTKEILGHGTEESVKFLSQFDYVQQLAPWHLDQTIDHRPEATDLNGKKWVAIPNFVDCEVFKPIIDGPQAIRGKLGIPPDAFVIGCVAAVKKHHKRIDYLIREFARLANRQVELEEEFEQKPTKPTKEIGYFAGGGIENSSSCSSRASVVQHSFPLPFLLIAGAKTDETDELRALAESLIPGRYKILTDCSRAQMPDLLRAMDVFVLASLFEMMPIALLEALASGLPCVVNQHPVLEWMTGVEEEKSFEQKHAKDAKGGDSYAFGGNTGSLLPQQISPAAAASSPLPPLRTSRASVQVSSTGGEAIDMSQDGALAAALAALTPEWLALHGQQARKRAVAMFSTEAVIGQYVEYYRVVMRER